MTNAKPQKRFEKNMQFWTSLLVKHILIKLNSKLSYVSAEITFKQQSSVLLYSMNLSPQVLKLTEDGVKIYFFKGKLEKNTRKLRQKIWLLYICLISTAKSLLRISSLSSFAQ